MPVFMVGCSDSESGSDWTVGNNPQGRSESSSDTSTDSHDPASGPEGPASATSDGAVSTSHSDGMATEPDPSDGPSTGGGSTSGPVGADGEATSEGPRFDVGGAVGDEGGGTPCDPSTEKCSCTGVDILFSVDISGSQQSNLQAMRSQFSSFVDVMFDRLPPNVDLHVGITTAAVGHSAPHGDSGCGFADGLGGKPPPPQQQLYTPPTAAIVPGNGMQGRLWEYAGKAFFAVNTSDADREPLKAWFTGAATEVVNAAVAKVYGDAELGAAAAAWAFHPISQTPGFIRDRGAVTVLFLTGDADHSYYVEDAKFLHDTVVAAKAGCGGDKCIIGAGMLNAGCDDPMRYAALDFLRSFGKEPIWGKIDWFMSDPEEWKRVLGDALAQVVAETCATIPPAE